MTPDWLIQSIWFMAGVLATGAIWYFLSRNERHRALWTGFCAAERRDYRSRRLHHAAHASLRKALDLHERRPRCYWNTLTMRPKEVERIEAR
jgi:hypothetical protein